MNSAHRRGRIATTGEIREAVAWRKVREEAASLVAVQCAWCRQFRSDQDRELAQAGVPISHGICQGCSRKLREDHDYIGTEGA